MMQIDSTCLIDDDPIFVFAVKRILKSSHLSENISIYNNGKDAINGLKQIIDSGKTIPNLILLDLNMPIMDGWQFLDEFIKLKLSQKVTIYIVSSSIDPADFNRAKNYEQVSDFIVKPITRKLLLEIIKLRA